MWVESETVPMAVTAEQNFDLSFLSREETQTVLRVLERDRHLKMIEAERVGRLFPGRDTRLGMKNSVSSSPQRAQTVWSTMLPVSPVQANPPPIKASPRLNTQANPPPMKALPRLNTQANTESQAGRAGDSSGGVGKHPSLRSRLSSLLSIPFLQRKSNSRDGNISRDVNISRDGNISRDVNISSGHRDMGSSSRGTDASSSSSISRPQQVNRHGISSEESQAIRKQREITERDKQTESSFPGTHLKAESCTDQTHREKHDRQSPDISRPTKSASRPASLLTTRPASLSEGTSPSPSPEQDRHTVGISIPNGTVTRPEGWEAEQQSIVGPETATGQLQCEAFAFINTELGNTDRSTWPADPKEQFTTGRCEKPEPTEGVSPPLRGSDITEESCDPTEDGPLPSKADEDEDEDEDSREASLPITPDDTSLCCVPLTSDREIKKDVNQPISGGTETQNLIHRFSNENQKPSIPGRSPACGQTDHSVSEILCDDNVNTQTSVSTRQDNREPPVAVVSMLSSANSLKQNNINNLLKAKRSTFKASNKHVTSSASPSSETEETRTGSVKSPTTGANASTADTDQGGSALASSACRTESITAGRSHRPHSLSSAEQARSPSPRIQGPGRSHLDAVPRRNTYLESPGSLAPLKARHYLAGTSLEKAKSCERLPLRAASADSSTCHSSSAPRDTRFMSSSDRIHILAMQHAQGPKSGRDDQDSNGLQLPYNQKRGRSYSTYDLSSSSHSHTPSHSNSRDNFKLARKQRSLTVSTSTLPQHGLAVDEHPHQSNLSVFATNRLRHSQQATPDREDFRGDFQQCTKFSSHDNLSKNSLNKFDSLKVSINADPIPIKKKRNYPPDMNYPTNHFNYQEHDGRSDVVLTDTTFKEYHHTTLYSTVKEKNNERWSSVSDLENPEVNHKTQKHIFVEQHTFFRKKQTFTKPRDLLLDSTGSQISLDWSSEDTDEDIFSISHDQCSQGSPPNYFTNYDRGLKCHHKSSSNVHQEIHNRTNKDSYSGKFSLKRGRSFSVTNISSNRAVGLRRISTGSRTATLADLRDCEDFDNAVSHRPKTLSCTLDQTVPCEPVKSFQANSHMWRGGSLISSVGSLLSTSQVCLDRSFPSSSYYLTHEDLEDSDSDTISEGEYYLYDQDNDLESSL